MNTSMVLECLLESIDPLEAKRGYHFIMNTSKYVQNVCSVEVCMHHMYNNNGLQEGKQHRRKWKTKREVVKKRKQALQ